jgi:hypothetical protein
MPTSDRDPLAQKQMENTNNAAGMAGSADGRMASGVGQAAEHMVQATRTGRFPNDNTSGQRSQGETAGSGSIYAAVINERPNISNPRNQGPTRAPSRMGSSVIPVTTMASRNTGTVGA